MRTALRILASAGILASLAWPAMADDTKLTIATVNNGDMIRMQSLTDDFKAKNPGIDVQWVTLEENMLRQRVTTDIATKGGQFDVLTIGTYEVPIWAKKGWLVPLDNLGTDYDVDDLLPAIRTGLSVDGKLYAAPFYGESSMLMYRKDLFDKAGLTMPDQPTWDFVKTRRREDHRSRHRDLWHLPPRQGRLGREHGLPDDARPMPSARRWFNEQWKPEFDGPEWKAALTFYVDLMKNYGPPGASSNGFNENLALVQLGQMRHVGRCDGRRLLRQRSEAVEGRRSRSASRRHLAR